MSVTQLNLVADVPLTSTTLAPGAPVDDTEQELHFAVNPNKARQIDLEVEFADGKHLLPGWLVVNLGGQEMLEHPGSQARLKHITYTDFMAFWSEQNTNATIARAVLKVRNQHLTQIKKGIF